MSVLICEKDFSRVLKRGGDKISKSKTTLFAFVKAVASGNDFIIMDGFGGSLAKLRWAKLAQEFCRRRFSVGADGLLVIERSKQADLRMRIFNPDGTEVDMCGNGARCVALYAVKKKICRKEMTIETGAGILEAQAEQDSVKIRMPEPKGLKLALRLNINGRVFSVSYVNTGVPHVVCFVDNLKDFNVEENGKAIRYHPEFLPAGTNADFVQVVDKTHLKLRTYERGVEKETLACGTGSVAAGIVTIYRLQQQRSGAYQIKVDTQSGEALQVYFRIEKEKITDVFLAGQAKIIYEGELYV